MMEFLQRLKERGHAEIKMTVSTIERLAAISREFWDAPVKALFTTFEEWVLENIYDASIKLSVRLAEYTETNSEEKILVANHSGALKWNEKTRETVIIIFETADDNKQTDSSEESKDEQDGEPKDDRA